MPLRIYSLHLVCCTNAQLLDLKYILESTNAENFAQYRLVDLSHKSLKEWWLKSPLQNGITNWENCPHYVRFKSFEHKGYFKIPGLTLVQ